MARKFRELMADWSHDRIAEVEAGARELLLETPLYRLRQARSMTQDELAAAMGTSQTSVSKLERRPDVYLSSVRRYVEAMGGELEITARFPDAAFRLDEA
jgi:transcriptional regulator with XRE-family HTH domain